MTHASVFSGIGGPEVAATMLGWQNLFHCEINPFGRAVLDYWYPESKSYEDITKTDFTEWRGRVNVLTGGFPCQPFSYAGKRRGAEDDRYLWPHMHRCINEIKPDWVVAENVGGILTMVEQGSVAPMADAPSLFDEDNPVHRYQYRGTFTLERICRDIEADGYEVQPVLIPACAVGAPHRRDRVFIVGHRLASDTAQSGAEGLRQGRQNAIHRPQSAADTRSGGQSASELENKRARQTLQREGGVESFDGTERPCVSRTSADTDGDRGREVVEYMEPEQPNGAVAFGNGWEWNAPSPRWAYNTEGGWLPTQSPVHRGNHGFSFNVDGLTIPFAKWRNESVKAYGNAIVPQVMYEIFRAIEEVEKTTP